MYGYRDTRGRAKKDDQNTDPAVGRRTRVGVGRWDGPGRDAAMWMLRVVAGRGDGGGGVGTNDEDAKGDDAAKDDDDEFFGNGRGTRETRGANARARERR